MGQFGFFENENLRQRGNYSAVLGKHFVKRVIFRTAPDCNDLNGVGYASGHPTRSRFVKSTREKGHNFELRYRASVSLFIYTQVHFFWGH